MTEPVLCDMDHEGLSETRMVVMILCTLYDTIMLVGSELIVYEYIFMSVSSQSH